MRILKWLALTVIGAYLALVAGLTAVQRNLLYMPDPAIMSPASQDVSGIAEIHLSTQDGETLRAWWRPPDPGKPVFIYFGGQNDRLHRQGRRYRALSRAGAGFLFLSYRGYAGSTGHPSEEGLHQDALAAYRWVSARYPPAQIVVHGFSLGSGVAVRLAAEKPVRALILEAPFTAAVDVAAQRYPYAPVRLLMFDQFRSRDWIGKVTAPVFIASGQRDRIVPYQQGKDLFALAHEPKEFFSAPEAGHNNLARFGLYDRIWTFLGIGPA